MIIEVTQEHLDTGTRDNGRICPVAMAWQVTTGANIWVGRLGITWRKKRYPHSKRLMRYIAAIDAGAVVKPSRFQVINLPKS